MRVQKNGRPYHRLVWGRSANKSASLGLQVVPPDMWTSWEPLLTVCLTFMFFQHTWSWNHWDKCQGRSWLAQEDDAVMRSAIQAVKHGKWPENDSSPEMSRLKKEMGKLMMKDGLLHCLSKRSSGEELMQLVLPREFREVVLKATHDDLGHLGIERTSDLLRVFLA